MVDDDELLESLAQATGLTRGELDSTWSLLDLGLTSFRVMQALMRIEETFGIEFSDDEIVQFPVVAARALPGLVRQRITTSG